MKVTLKIGVFAPRAQGKTVAMAAWHAMREGDGIALEALDSPTMEYLRGPSAELVKGVFPPGTVEAPKVLRWQARVGSQTSALECIDFPGEFADPIRKKNAPEAEEK